MPSKKVLWCVFRGLNAFLEGIWSPRESFQGSLMAAPSSWCPGSDTPRLCSLHAFPLQETDESEGLRVKPGFWGVSLEVPRLGY